MTRQELRVYNALTDRERECIRWFLRSLTQKQMGRLMGITTPTVKTHMVRVYRKTKTSSRLELLVYLTARPALRDAILDDPEKEEE